MRPVSGSITVLVLIRKLPFGLRDCIIKIAVSECAHAKRVDWSARNPELYHLIDFRFGERRQSQFLVRCHDAFSARSICGI